MHGVRSLAVLAVVVLPINRSHRNVGSTVVNHNDYPREALLESLLRYVEEDLAASGREHETDGP